MSELRVHLQYMASAYTPSTRTSSSAPLALPVNVMDGDGSVVANGVTSNEDPAEFNLEPDYETVFVRLTWPTGKTQTQKVSLAQQSRIDVTFDDASFLHDEWSAWAVPRVKRAAALSNREPSADTSIQRYDDVWLRFWQFSDGAWTVAEIKPQDSYKNSGAKQIDFELSQGGFLLQLGGPNVRWRFVSLPADGPCRVLLTPNDSPDPRADPLRVVVTGFRQDAETLLEFLSRDALGAASSLYKSMAVRLLAGKNDDPVAAVAGAYFLLRSGGWEDGSIPSWLDNLSTRFPWIADTAIIRCIAAIRRGLSTPEATSTAMRYFAACRERGLPVYAEALSLMREAASVLQYVPDRDAAVDSAAEVVEQLSVASTWAGSAFSFYGKRPDEPSPMKVLGTPEGAESLNLLWLREI
jgi:hypothetical protein